MSAEHSATVVRRIVKELKSCNWRALKLNEVENLVDGRLERENVSKSYRDRVIYRLLGCN